MEFIKFIENLINSVNADILIYRRELNYIL
jgi:hypothetical protein